MLKDTQTVKAGSDSKKRMALVVGGTGMLAEASVQLKSLGFCQVVVPSRRGPVPEGCEWFAADWRDPEAFGLRVSTMITSPVDLLVVWVHYPHREALWSVLGHFVDKSTVVVEVWSHAGARPDELRRLVGHAHWHVVLGRSGSRGDGWLGHHKISRGVIDVIERALADPSRQTLTVVGTLDRLDEIRIRASLGIPSDSA